jgi:hypothetical protein
MGDDNVYKLIFQDFSPELLPQIVEVASTFGYWFTNSNGLTILHNGRDNLKFGNIKAAQAHLFFEGGSIDFSRACESCEGKDVSFNISISFKPEFREITLRTTMYLRRDDWDFVELAFDLRRLWHILAKRLKPIHGYVTTGWTFDSLLRDPEINSAWEVFERRLVDYTPPPVLFWANYFDWAYYDHMDKSIFSEIPYRLDDVPDEYAFIYLAEFPWDDHPLAILKNWKYQLVTSE